MSLVLQRKRKIYRENKCSMMRIKHAPRGSHSLDCALTTTSSTRNCAASHKRSRHQLSRKHPRTTIKSCNCCMSIREKISRMVMNRAPPIQNAQNSKSYHKTKRQQSWNRNYELTKSTTALLSFCPNNAIPTYLGFCQTKKQIKIQTRTVSRSSAGFMRTRTTQISPVKRSPAPPWRT